MDDLIDAFECFITSVKEHDEVLSEYDGCEWSWHGQNLIDDVDKAKENLKKEFQKLIKIEVEKILEGKLNASSKKLKNSTSGLKLISALVLKPT